MGSRSIYISVLLLLTACMSSERKGAFQETTITVPAVHTRYLERALPSGGIASQFNPPVLRWPREKNQGSYDVRLSTDSLFGGRTIQASGLNWAMFNPHSKLDHGTWYWQYRVGNGKWSSLNVFIVDETSTHLVSPAASALLAGIPQDHPRVLTTDPTLLLKLANETDARSILAEATRLLRHEIPRENDGTTSRVDPDKERAKKLRQDASSSLGKRVFTTVNTLSQAALLSSDARFAERAKAIALSVARWDPDGVTGSGTNDFADARCMLAMALVFDTFYDDLNDSERTLLLKAVRTRANRFYHEWVNNQEARLLSGHVWQHILHYFFQTAMALYSHDPDAEKWLTYSYELFVARAPILGGKDGGWIEGASYFKMNMETLIEIPLLIKQFTGFDFIAAHPWYKNQIDWLVYHVPPGSSSDGFGDNAEEIRLPGSAYVAFATEMAKLTGSELAAWYAQQVQAHERVDLAAESTLRWVRLTRTRDLPVPVVVNPPMLPIAKVFGEVGLTAMHSDPTNTKIDLMVAMRSSPFGCYGHFLADQNAFNILYGGKPTFYRTGYKVTMTDPHRTGWYQHTKSQNGILVDGEGQPYSTEAYGIITRFLSGEQLAYALGDAGNAYTSTETGEDRGVRKFYRHLLLLKPDIVVVYDELEAAEPVTWSWLLHSMADIEVDEAENTFRSDFGVATGGGGLWSSTPFDLAVTDTFDVPAVNWRGAKDASGKLKTYEADQWHLKAMSIEKVRNARFLAVLQVSPGADPRQLSASNGKSGLSVQAGSWKIFAELSADVAGELRIEHEDGLATFRYEGGRTPVLIEQTDKGEKRSEAVEIVPWHLRLMQMANY